MPGHAMFAAMANWLRGDRAAADRWLVEMRRRNPNFSRLNAAALVPSARREFTEIVRRAALDLGL